MYMTDEQVKTKAENYGKQYYSEHQARTIAEDGYMAGCNDSKHLLQQTACYTALELLQQMLNEEQVAYMQSKNSMEADMRLYNEDALKVVIKLINARQANGV